MYIYSDKRSDNIFSIPHNRLVHLNVEDCSQELLGQQSCAIKNQRGANRIPHVGGIFRSKALGFGCDELVLKLY